MTLTRGKVYAALASAVALAMGLSLRNGFVYDDLPAIVNNSRVTDPAQWHTIPRSPYWLGTLWRPVTVALYAVQWFVGHGEAWVFHAVSLVAYFAVGVALVWLLETLFAGRRSVLAPAAIATILFLVHPVHVEVVANSVGQAELWVALALLGATIVYLRARRSGTERRSLPVLLAIVALGIMSKEQGFVAPLLLAGAEWLLLGDKQEPLRARLRLLIPVTALALLLFVIRGILLNSNIGETPAIALRALNPAGRFVTFLGVIPEWARLIVWPIHLQADYGPPGIPIGGPMTPRHWLGLALLVGLVALFIRCRKRAPVVAFGLLWAAIALAPVSNLLTPTGIVVAERVLFLPSIGFAIALAASRPGRSTANGGAETRGLVAERMTFAILAILALLFTIRSATRVPIWGTQDRFFDNITRDGARAYRGWKVAAEYWDSAHDRPRAIEELKHSIELWPHDYEVAERLGQIYRQGGRCDQAVPVFTAGLRADSSATSLRAKLIECLIVVKDFDTAEKVAIDGAALGQKEFESMQERVRRARADSATARPH